MPDSRCDPIDSLPLPRRAINALRNGGIRTLEDLSDWNDDALLSLPQFGPAYLTALRALAAQGLTNAKGALP